jgi:N-acyl-D-aspartate/D-glutamate deacylase
MCRAVLGLMLGLLMSLLIAVPAAGAASAYCGRVNVYGHSERVYKIRGATCAKALSVARYYARRADSPAPWMCLLSHGELYRGHRADFVCAYGGKRGNVRNWPHAVIVTR